MDKTIVNNIFSFLLCFCSIVVYFSSNSYAIEDEEFPEIWGMLPVQDEPHTLWDTGCRGCFTDILIPVFLATNEVIDEPQDCPDDFEANIELGQDVFSDLSIGRGLGGALLFVSHERDWGQIDLQDIAEGSFPVSIETIDENERSFKVILGDKNNTNIGFIIKPDGIYGLEGIFKDSIVEFKWQGKKFRFGVLEDGEALKVTLEPLSSDLSSRISYSKEFTLGNFEGELKFHFASGKPYLEIQLKNGDKKTADVDISPKQTCLDLNFQAIVSDKGIVSINADSLMVGNDKLEGSFEVTVEEENQTVVLSLGNSRYLEINQNGSTREIIDEFFTELAEEMVFLLPQWAEDNEDVDPEMTVDDIKEMLWEATGDDLKELADVIEEINEERQGLIIPDKSMFFMDFSLLQDERGVEFTLPLVADELALKSSLGRNVQRVGFIFPLGNKTVEAGYLNESGDEMMVFKLADLSHISSVELGVSNEGIGYVEWLLGGLRGVVDTSGFEVGSSGKSLLGLSALDVLLQGLDGESNDLGWDFRYSFGGEYNLRLNVPLDEFGYKGAKISFELDSNRFDFRTRMPVGGGILKVDSDGIIEYQLKRKDIVLTFGFKERIWSLSFKTPTDSEDSEDEN